MSHRGGRRRRRPPGDLRVVGATVLCSRCGVQVARNRAAPGEEWAGFRFPSPRLEGTGWHVGDDGVWRPESNVRRRVRQGQRPLPSHRRVVMKVYSDKLGIDPTTGENVTIGVPVEYETPPQAVEAYIAPGRLVECPACGAISRFTPGPARGSETG